MVKYKKRFLGNSIGYSLLGYPVHEYGILSDVKHFFPYSVKNISGDVEFFLITVWHVKYGSLIGMQQSEFHHLAIDDLGFDNIVDNIIKNMIK